MTLPFLRLRGTPYEQGLQHGHTLKAAIDHNLALYYERFAAEAGLDRERVGSYAARYADLIQQLNPAYFAGMRGIAAGSKRDLHEIVALNARYELLYAAISARRMADGCTAVAVPPERSADGHLLIGQNWDWFPSTRGAIVQSRRENGVETLAFTEAGIYGGKIGLNSAGLGLCITGLYSTADDLSRLSKPFHVRCYELLGQPSVDAALPIVQDSGRVCSVFYLLAQAPAQVAHIESAPAALSIVGCDGSCLVHTNHFLYRDALGIGEPDDRAYSKQRWRRMATLLTSPAALTLDDLQGNFRDHEDYPNSVCMHVDPADPIYERTVTVCSIILDLTAKVMYVADGSPCTHPYERITFIEYPAEQAVEGASHPNG